MAAHAHSIGGRHAVATVEARPRLARPQALEVGVGTVQLLVNLLLTVCDVQIVPRGHAHTVGRKIRQMRIVQGPLRAARRTNVNNINVFILDHFLTGDNAIMGNGHSVGREKLSGLKDDDSIELYGLSATDDVPSVIREERVEV
eukprot:780-Heterocapsa_arctica.AAC.1